MTSFSFLWRTKTASWRLDSASSDSVLVVGMGVS